MIGWVTGFLVAGWFSGILVLVFPGERGLCGGWLFVLFVRVFLLAGWLVDWMGNGFFGGWMVSLDSGF